MVGPKRSFDDAGGDAIDSDAQTIELGKRAYEAADGVFAGDVERCAEAWTLSGNRADMDDAFRIRS